MAAVARARPARLLHRVAAVDVGAVVQQRAQHAQPVQVDRDELIADVPVGHVHGGLQRPAEDVAADDALGLALAVAELAYDQRHRLGAHALHRQPRGAALGVRVGAGREQQLHEVLVPVDHRGQQGPGAVGARPVHVGAGRQQRPDRADGALAGGEQQRRRAAVRTRVDVRAEGDERLDGRDVPLGPGPHERGLPVPCLAGVDVGAGVREPLHGVGPPGARREHQGRLARVDRLPRVVRIDAGVQQQRQDRGVAVAGRQGQRRHAVVVGGLDVGPGADQRRGRVRVAAVRRPVQGGGPVALSRVGVRVPRQQRAHRLRVAALRRVGERRLGRRAGSGPRRAEAGGGQHDREAPPRGWCPHHRCPEEGSILHPYAAAQPSGWSGCPACRRPAGSGSRRPPAVNGAGRGQPAVVRGVQRRAGSADI